MTLSEIKDIIIKWIHNYTNLMIIYGMGTARQRVEKAGGLILIVLLFK